MFSFNICLGVLLAVVAVSSEKAVICYHGSWSTYRSGNGQFGVDNIDPYLCTHLIYAFAGIDTSGNIISLDPWLDLPNGRGNYVQFNALKKKNPNLKTLLAVGGWNEGSAKYSVMADSPTQRRNFVTSALQFLSLYGFDGLDLDWEYPNRRDTVYAEDDIDNFTQLLKELSEAFQGYDYLLTAAVSSVKAAASQSYDIPAISKYLDYIHIMTYDLYGPWDEVTGHNAGLHKGEGFSDSDNAEDLYTVDAALQYWISAGSPPEKLAVGIPFYAHTFVLAYEFNTSVRAPNAGYGFSGPYTLSAGFVGYNEFCNQLQTESWTVRYDSLAKVPYAFKGTDWVSYDDPQSIVEKIEYAKTLGVNNVMVWSIETDDFHSLCGSGPNPLLGTINEALGKPVRVQSVTV